MIWTKKKEIDRLIKNWSKEYKEERREGRNLGVGGSGS